MAGVKGRSGGARPGAGRKKKPAAVLTAPAAVKAKAKAKPTKLEKPAKKAAAPAPAATSAPVVPDVLDGLGQDGFDPRPALEQVAIGLLDPSPSQMKALIALMPYVHTKKGEGGKKEQRQEAAQKVVSRFAPAAPPKLAAVGGRKV